MCTTFTYTLTELYLSYSFTVHFDFAGTLTLEREEKNAISIYSILMLFFSYNLQHHNVQLFLFRLFILKTNSLLSKLNEIKLYVRLNPSGKKFVCSVSCVFSNRKWRNDFNISIFSEQFCLISL